MKKRLAPFWRGFLVGLGALALLLAVTLGLLWAVLARYQSGQDAAALERAHARAPQTAFETFWAQAAPEYWAQEWLAAHPESYDTPENVAAELARRFSGAGVACWKAEGYTPEAPAYIVKDGDTPLARVTLRGSGLDWTVDAVTLYPAGTRGGSVTAPAGCAVYCNGRAMPESAAESAASPYELDKVAQPLSGTVTWLTYTVSGQLTEPVFTVEPPEGRTLALADGRWVFTLDGESAAPYREQGERFARALAYYYMMGSYGTEANMNAARAYLKWNSQAWQTVSGAYDGVTWATPYTDAVFEIRAGEPIVLADNCLSLDVSFAARGSYAGHSSASEGVYRIYYVDGGGGFEICNLFLS